MQPLSGMNIHAHRNMMNAFPRKTCKHILVSRSQVNTQGAGFTIFAAKETLSTRPQKRR